jgi:hypothetical protein
MTEVIKLAKVNGVRKRGSYFSDLASSLAADRRRDWFARGAIEGAPIACIAAPEKRGKSWMVADLAVQAIAGGAWLGVFEITRPGPVVIVDTENGAHEYARRVARIARAHGLDANNATRAVMHRWASDLLLVDGNSAIDELIEECLDVKPAAIVFDPWRNFLAGDENSATDTIAALRHVARIRDALSCPAILLHHVNRDGKMSGSRALRGRCDLFIEGGERSEGAAPIYRAMGRTLRPSDAISQPFRINLEHENDDDDRTACTRVIFSAIAEAPIPYALAADGELSKDAKRALAELQAHPEGLTARRLRDLAKWNGKQAAAALDELSKAALAGVEQAGKNGRSFPLWRATSEGE